MPYRLESAARTVSPPLPRSANPRDHRVNATITSDGSPQTVSPSTTVPTKLGTVAGDGTSNDADGVQGLIVG